jgi:glucose-6-phosphate 1-dehydrogenase
MGDLSRRHLLPALTRLLANDELPPNFSLIITGIESMTAEACRALVERELAVHAAQSPTAARSSLVSRISYLQADVRDVESLRLLAATEPLLIYFATPSEVVPAAVRAVFHAGIHRAPARFVLDKPFGLSRASAGALNAQILELMDERNVYRVDHFLYHHAVQELMRWRMRPDALSPVDSVQVVSVEIVWDETRAVRSDPLLYCGVVRDMIQSHLLQLAAIITMESPRAITHDDLARCRLAALRQISVTPDSGLRPLRARHLWDRGTATTAPGGGLPETFATVALHSQLPRWKNVDFILRAAKGVAESRRHIEFRFVDPSARSSPGFVRLEVLAGNLVFGVAGGQATSVSMNADGEPESASVRLLRAALSGDDTFTLHPEEPQEAWRVVEPLLQAWEAADEPMLMYPVGASVDEMRGGTNPNNA